MAKIISFVTVILCAIYGGLFKEMPSYINVCKRDQSTINDCIRDSIEALRPKLMDGLPELGIPGTDPFIIPQPINVNIDEIPLNVTIKNLKVTGGGNFVIKSLSMDLETFTARVQVRIPKLDFEGQYTADGHLLTLPMKGEGTFVGDAVKSGSEITMYSQLVERDGVEYLKVTKFEVYIKVKDYSVKLNGLFNGDKTLGDLVNRMIRDNRMVILQAARPYIESIASKFLLKFANKLVVDLPLDQILPLP